MIRQTFRPIEVGVHLEGFILSALLLLAVTSVAVALFRHLGLGSVLGLLIAGVVVGPHSPGPYVTPHVEDVRHFTELGVVLLLFVIGLEIKPGRLWSLRRDLLGLGSLQILLTGLAITLYVSLGTDSWKTALLIGLSLSLSSTAFVMQLLHEKGEFASRHGTGAWRSSRCSRWCRCCRQRRLSVRATRCGSRYSYWSVCSPCCSFLGCAWCLTRWSGWRATTIGKPFFWSCCWRFCWQPGRCIRPDYRWLWAHF